MNEELLGDEVPVPDCGAQKTKPTKWERFNFATENKVSGEYIYFAFLLNKLVMNVSLSKL